MAITSDSWKRTSKPLLREIFPVQQILVFTGVLFYVLLSALHTHISLSFRMGWCWCLEISNYGLQAASGPLYARRPFPWNWIAFLTILLALSLSSVFASIVWLRSMVAPGRLFWELFRETWQIAMGLCMGTGVLGFAAAEVPRKLRWKSALLEQVVERGSVALQQQEQELNRAREIQTDLLPKTLPQVPGWNVPEPGNLRAPSAATTLTSFG